MVGKIANVGFILCSHPWPQVTSSGRQWRLIAGKESLCLVAWRRLQEKTRVPVIMLLRAVDARQHPKKSVVMPGSFTPACCGFHTAEPQPLYRNHTVALSFVPPQAACDDTLRALLAADVLDLPRIVQRTVALRQRVVEFAANDLTLMRALADSIPGHL